MCANFLKGCNTSLHEPNAGAPTIIKIQGTFISVNLAKLDESPTVMVEEDNNKNW